MGECFYKLACLYGLSFVRADIASILEPIQLALSPGGSESVVHMLQAALDMHPDWIVISSDIRNAFNTRKRAHILSSLFQEAKLAPLWRLASWSYGSSSPLLMMDHGKVIFELLSSEGVKQGDVLASLLFALSMKDLYSDCIKNLDCHAAAVMDDFYLFGPAAPTFNAFDRFSSSLESRQTGLVLNLQKSVALIPSGDRKIAELCKSRKLSYTSKLLPCLGAAISRSRKELSKWLKQTCPKLHQSLFTLLLDPSLPSQYSYLIQG